MYLKPTAIIKSYLLLIIFIVTGCSSVSAPKKTSSQDAAPTGSVDINSIPNAVPKREPKSKYGNPKSYEVFGKRYYVMESSKGFVEKGIASWYGTKFHGRRTSSGETYDMYAMTAAHKNLPLPTYVKVTNLNNGKHIIVKVNDRGPFHENRIIDLSYTAALKLDIVKKGTGLVEVIALEPGQSVKATGAPVVTPTAASVAQPSFFIQVGSFGELSNAENMKTRLAPLGENLVSINESLISGNTFYRVRIGPLTNIEQADEVVNSLASLGITEHQIVLNE